MIVCSCNFIKEQDIVDKIHDLLQEDAWRLIVPVQVYHAMNKRGKCCGCFPNVVDIIVKTTEAYHKAQETPSAEIINLMDRLKQKHTACETARMLARARMQKTKSA